jgi:hypothetical protein
MKKNNENLAGGIVDVGGIVKPLVIAGLAVGAFFIGKKAIDTYKKNQAEKNIDTPEGQIALQLKNVFDSAIVSDEDFRQVYLQVNSSNSDAVYKQYKLLTNRNLSDDIGNRIGKDTLKKSVKTALINSKKDGVIKIDSEDNIQFLVAKGSKVVFTNPKATTAVYGTPKGILYYLTDPLSRPIVEPKDKVRVNVLNYTKSMTVVETQILPYNGIKLAADWTKYFRPFVATRKVFAIVKVEIKNTNGSTSMAWCDARDLSTITTLKGLDKQNSIYHLIS